jgi:REP element-mobilizing transposase RayT
MAKEHIDSHLRACKSRKIAIYKKRAEASRKLLQKCRKALVEIDGFDDDHLPLITEIEDHLEESDAPSEG